MSQPSPDAVTPTDLAEDALDVPEPDREPPGDSGAEPADGWVRA